MGISVWIRSRNKTIYFCYGCFISFDWQLSWFETRSIVLEARLLSLTKSIKITSTTCGKTALEQKSKQGFTKTIITNWNCIVSFPKKLFYTKIIENISICNVDYLIWIFTFSAKVLVTLVEGLLRNAFSDLFESPPGKIPQKRSPGA